LTQLREKAFFPLSRQQLKKKAMKKFLDKHAEKVTGTISCFDRLIFKGYLPLAWPDAMEKLIAHNGLKIKDFKRFVSSSSERLKNHAKALAERNGRSYRHLQRPARKEDLARQIAERDEITEGLVCVLTAVESCQSFAVVPGKGRPQIVNAGRKCLCVYYYFLDRELGFLHVRIQTWFPFTVQIYLNGHGWLARKLEQHGIAFEMRENAFLSIEDPERAQRIANRFVKRKWPRILSAFSRRVNPLMRDLLGGMEYYWVTDQAEYATDVLFRSPGALKGLYEKLLERATLRFSAEDVMTFLGRKLNGNFKGEIQGDLKKKRWLGARVKHRMKANWLKMYDKHGSVLRVETVINRPYEFKVRRSGVRQGEKVVGWFPMAKGVSNLYRYAEVSLSANERYFDALAEVDDPTEARLELHKVAQSKRIDGRNYRGFNPAAADEVALFKSVLRGEHVIQGFRNADIRHRLFKETKDGGERRRQSACVSRLFKRLHVHGLIAKIPRSRRWRVSRKGLRIMGAALEFHEAGFFDARQKICDHLRKSA
jgi:hypothetical protein